MRLTRELVPNQDPRYQYIVRDDSGTTLISTSDREKARTFLRNEKAQQKARQATQ